MPIKCTNKNVRIFKTILTEHTAQKNGEFDEETDLLFACKKVIEWMEENLER